MATLGPGKYDALATYAREQADAKLVVLLVLQGNKGSGFSVQADSHDPRHYLPELLRKLADDLDGGGRGAG